MIEGIEKHPAFQWGCFVCKNRLEKGITLRKMAQYLKISPSKYSEIEYGILKWLPYKSAIFLEEYICKNYEDTIKFWEMLDIAIYAKPELTCMGDIFTRMEVCPAFPFNKKENRPMTEREVNKLIDHILAPLN